MRACAGAACMCNLAQVNEHGSFLKTKVPGICPVLQEALIGPQIKAFRASKCTVTLGDFSPAPLWAPVLSLHRASLSNILRASAGVFRAQSDDVCRPGWADRCGDPASTTLG